jgi:hypothetical protein
MDLTILSLLEGHARMKNIETSYRVKGPFIILKEESHSGKQGTTLQ